MDRITERFASSSFTSSSVTGKEPGAPSEIQSTGDRTMPGSSEAPTVERVEP